MSYFINYDRIDKMDVEQTRRQAWYLRSSSSDRIFFRAIGFVYLGISSCQVGENDNTMNYDPLCISFEL